MADIPPDTDTTTERNHSNDGGADQQQLASLQSARGERNQPTQPSGSKVMGTIGQLK